MYKCTATSNIRSHTLSHTHFSSYINTTHTPHTPTLTHIYAPLHAHLVGGGIEQLQRSRDDLSVR